MSEITKDRRLGEYLAMYISDFSEQMNLMRKRIIEMVQCNHESRKANKPNTVGIDIVSGIERITNEQR